MRRDTGWYRAGKALAALTLAATLMGCGRETAEPRGDAAAVATAATLGEQSILSATEYLSQAPYAAADRENGERQARLCRACHSFEQGGANMIGPNLHGFFGSPVGASEGFDYSAAIREADFTWTPRALDAWLQQPGRFLPGNRMSFGGVGNASDRADLVAYLLVATSETANTQTE